MASHPAVIGSLDGSESFDQELQAVIAPPGALYRMDTTSVDLDQGQAQNVSATPAAGNPTTLGQDVPAAKTEAEASPSPDAKDVDKSKEPWTSSNDPWNKGAQDKSSAAASSSGP